MRAATELSQHFKARSEWLLPSNSSDTAYAEEDLGDDDIGSAAVGGSGSRAETPFRHWLSLREARLKRAGFARMQTFPSSTETAADTSRVGILPEPSAVLAREIVLTGGAVPQPPVASAGPAEVGAVPEPSSSEQETDDAIVASELDRLDLRGSDFNGCCGFGRKKFEASPALELILPAHAGWEERLGPICFFKKCWKIDSGLESFRSRKYYLWLQVSGLGLGILIAQYSPLSMINTLLLLILMDTLSRLGLFNICAFNCVKVVELRKEGSGFRIQASDEDKLTKEEVVAVEGRSPWPAALRWVLSYFYFLQRGAIAMVEDGSNAFNLLGGSFRAALIAVSGMVLYATIVTLSIVIGFSSRASSPVPLFKSFFTSNLLPFATSAVLVPAVALMIRQLTVVEAMEDLIVIMADERLPSVPLLSRLRGCQRVVMSRSACCHGGTLNQGPDGWDYSSGRVSVDSLLYGKIYLKTDGTRSNVTRSLLCLMNQRFNVYRQGPLECSNCAGKKADLFGCRIVLGGIAGPELTK